MNSLKKFTAAAVSVSLASTLFGCTPSIGGNATVALTVDGYEVPAGMLIYYTMQGYSEASTILENQNGTPPTVKELRNASIDSVDSTDWIQNKATEYCIDFAAIQHEFDAIGGKLSQEDLDQAESMAEYYFAQDARLKENGVSIDTMKKIAESTFKEQEIFKYYYGFEGSEGCSEEELKDYFDDNFARVKYVSIDLKNSEGEKVSPDEERKLRKMADEYVKQVNAKTSEMDKMHELDAVQEDYDEYVAAQTTTAEGEAALTTTTTTTTADPAESTTTTDPYANERLLQKSTTTSAENAEVPEEAGTEPAETAEETDTEKNTRLFNEFVFNELPLNKAQVYDYGEDAIYVVMRGDLRVRMTEDDFWTEDYITSIQSMKYYEAFKDMLDSKADQLTSEKNKNAYRRYAPFKLELEAPQS